MTAPRIEKHRGGPTACELQVWRLFNTKPGGSWVQCARESRFVIVRPSLSSSGGRSPERRQAACGACAAKYSAASAVPMPGERTLFEEGAERV